MDFRTDLKLDFCSRITYRVPVVNFADFTQWQLDEDLDGIPGWNEKAKGETGLKLDCDWWLRSINLIGSSYKRSVPKYSIASVKNLGNLASLINYSHHVYFNSFNLIFFILIGYN